MAASERPDWPGVPGLTAEYLAAEDIDISVVLRGIGLSQSRIDAGIDELEWVSRTYDDQPFKFRLKHVRQFARGLNLREQGLGRLEEAAFVPLILAFLGRGAGALSTFTHVDLTYTEDNWTLHMIYLEGLKSFPHLDVDSAASLCANLGHQSSKVHSLCLRGQRVFGAGKGCEMLGQVLISNRCLKELYLSSTGLGSEGVKLLASGLKENHTLEHLNIGGNHGIGDEGTGYVAELLVDRNMALKFLRLSGIGMKLRGVEALSTALSRNTTLERLDIGLNPGIGDEGTGYVAELLVDPNMPLKFLGLSGIGMGLGGFEVLSAALSRNTTLQELSIGTDLITRQDVVELLRVLTYGSLTGTSIELGNMHEVHFPVASMIARNMYRSLTCLGLTGAPLINSDEWVEDFIPARHQTSTLKQLHLRQIRFPEFAIDNAIRALEEVGFNSDSPPTFRLQHVAQFVRALRLEYDRSEWLKASIVALLLALVGRDAGVLSTVTGVDMTYTRYPKYTKDSLDLFHLEGLKSFPHLDEDSAASLCANLGHQSSKVHSLCLSGQKVFGAGKGCEMLAQALRSNRCLKELYLPSTGLGSEGVKLLVSALEENHTLERLDIGLNPGIGDEGAGYVAELLVGNMPLNFLGLSGIGMGLGGLEALSTALSRNTTLQDLGMGGHPISEEGMELLLRVRTPAKGSLTSIELGNMHISVESLASMIARNRSLTCLGFTDAPLSSDEWVEHIIPALNQNSTLKELHLTGANGVTDYSMFSVESLASIIARNRSLTCLGLTGAPLSSDEWVEHIIPALRENATLKTLSVRGSKGVTPTSVLEALIDMLDSSETALEVIDVEDTPLSRAGMAGRLAEALRIRKEYGATLKGQSTRTPTCGRLVLCGYEFSGKTTICKTMRRITDGELPTCHGTKMAFRNFFRKHAAGWRHFLYGKQASRELEHRTRGYEIVVLRNESHRRTTIWDFAGQEEYYVLHDFVLPNARNTCFLFVCSAVYPAYHDPQHLAGQPRTKDDMAKQFLYWLRFLASNAKPGTPPRVIFVLTNKDGLGTRAKHTSTGWANNVVTEMKEKFENVIHLEDKAVVVNAQNFGDITGLQDLVEKRLQDLLAQGPEEFVVCEHVRLALQEWTGNNPSKIFIKKEQFQAICRGKVKQKMGYAEYRRSKLATPDGQNAVLAYLNDVGEIICPPTLDFLVVNPTWFGRGVLGSLIDAFNSTSEPGGLVGSFIGYVKDCLPGENDIWRGLNHQHGFVAYRDVEELLKTSLRTTHLTKIITPEDLIELMIKLDMCYKEKPEVKTSRLFIPAVFDDDEELAANGKRQLGWKLGRRPGTFHHVGRRLLCRNTTLTLLSPGFFPRLQVVLRNYYHSKGWTENQAFQIDRNLIGFAEDGHEVLVEYSGNIDYFVDILAKSDHTYLRTLQFIREHVMGKIINFCASPQGCPGVVLVDAVIRPFCVEQLHLCADRIDHAVLVSDLEDKLANDDEKACKHIWKKQIQGTDIVDYALDLLEGMDSYKTFNFKRTSTGLQPALTQEDFDKVFQWSRLLDNRGHSRTTSSAPGIQQEGTDDCYDSNVVKGQKRGIAVLISMEKYNSGDRLGGAVDRGRLEALAGSLSLEVIALVDRSAAELREHLMNVQEECVLPQDECFVCFVNAHGNTTQNGEHFIRDKVGHWILLDDIVGPFRTCQKLRGKPKLFVVNSCRGSNIVAGAEAPGPSSDQRPYQQSSEGNEYRYVEDLSDCLVAFSTSGGSVSARDPMSGTSFVTALVEAFNDKRHNTDVLNIIRSVNCAVVHKDNYWVDEHGNERPIKQCPIVVTSLTKRFFLR